jgi:hypothetical protein
MKRYIVTGWDKKKDITDKLNKLGKVEKISKIYNLYLLESDCELGDIYDIGDVLSAELEEQARLNQQR